MKYYLFFEDYEGNMHQIGYVDGTGMEEQDVIDALWKQIHEYIRDQLNNCKTYYFNIWNEDGFTVIDYGSHSQFFKILPTIDLCK